MSVFPADFPHHERSDKADADPRVVAGDPLRIIPGIFELARREEADARAAWQQAREARFAEAIYDDLTVLDDVVARLADKSKSSATTRKYAAHWVKFTKFAAECILDDGFGMRALPCSPELAAWFLVCELTRGQSYSAIKQACAAISDAHTTNNLPDPTQALVCRAAVRLARQHDGKFPQAASDGKANGKLNGKHKETSDGHEGT